MLGSVKVNLSQDTKVEKDEYAWIISARLRNYAICNSQLNNYEALFILEDTSKKVLNLQIPDLKFLALNSFRKLVQTNFFQNMDLLKGLSLCDIDIKNYEDLVQGYENYKIQRSSQRGDKNTAFSQIVKDDNYRKRMLQHIKFDDQVKLLNFDFNFKTTINRAINCNAILSINFLLEKVFQDYEFHEYYYNLVMLDLIRILHSKDLHFETFFSTV